MPVETIVQIADYFLEVEFSGELSMPSSTPFIPLALHRVDVDKLLQLAYTTRAHKFI